MQFFELACAIVALSPMLPIGSHLVMTEPSHVKVDIGHCVPEFFDLRSLTLVCLDKKPMTLVHVKSLFPKRLASESAADYEKRRTAYVNRAQIVFEKYFSDRGVFSRKDATLAFVAPTAISCPASDAQSVQPLRGRCSVPDPDGLVVTGGVDIGCILVGEGLAKFMKSAPFGYKTNCQSSLKRFL